MPQIFFLAGFLTSSVITLTMEVSYPFHSHLIGRSGQNVNQLTMKQSGTWSYFTDTNRVAGNLKSNTVVDRRTVDQRRPSETFIGVFG